MFLHIVLGRKIYPTLLRPRTFIHNSFSLISSRPEGLPKSPRPRLFKPEWASNILQQPFDFRKKNTLHRWCAGLIVHGLLTQYTQYVAMLSYFTDQRAVGAQDYVGNMIVFYIAMGSVYPLSEHVDIFPVRLVPTFHRVFSVYLTLAIYLA